MKSHSFHWSLHGEGLQAVWGHPPPFTPVGTRMLRTQGWQQSPELPSPAEAMGSWCPSDLLCGAWKKPCRSPVWFFFHPRGETCSNLQQHQGRSRRGRQAAPAPPEVRTWHGSTWRHAGAAGAAVGSRELMCAVQAGDAVNP